MPDDPLLHLLDRERVRGHVREHFTEAVSLLEQLTNYGTALIPRAFGSSDRGIRDLVTIGSLLKQSVAMLDAIQALVSEGAVYAAHLQARTLFEASVCLDWILQETIGDTRAIAYHAANLRNQLLWARRAIRGTPEKDRFEELLGSLRPNVEAAAPGIGEDAARQVSEIIRVLYTERFAPVNARFDVLRGNRPYDPPWHAVVGAPSFRQVCAKAGRLPEYEVFYTIGSEIAHASSQRGHYSLRSGEVAFHAIRSLEALTPLLRFVVPTCLKTFFVVLEAYRPDEVSALRTKYRDEWRSAFFSLRTVTYSEENADRIKI